MVKPALNKVCIYEDYIVCKYVFVVFIIILQIRSLFTIHLIQDHSVSANPISKLRLTSKPAKITLLLI